jgi:hypothetical protein
MIKILFISALVLIGATYVWKYEKAPLGERVQIFSVGIGMIIGCVLLYS